VRELRTTGLKAVPALLLPIILIGGILLGTTTPTEVSAVAVVYGLVVAFLWYRDLSLKRLWSLIVSTVSTTGMILFVVGTAAAFSWSLTIANVPQEVGVNLAHVGDWSLVGFVVLSILVVIVVSSGLEGLPALLILGPLLIPVAGHLGMSTTHFAIVFLIAHGIGLFAPPVGIGFYVSCLIMGTSLESTIRPMLSYLGVLLLALLVIAFVPWVTLLVPVLLKLQH
jgi:tripartite ATP-independent transporter DctM subunit